MTIKNMAIIYELICDEYAKKFAKKQQLTFDYWIADTKEIACFNDEYFFGIGDIRLDLDTGQPKGLIMRWQEDGVANHFANPKSDYNMNYASYTKGLRYEDLKPRGDDEI